jgi:hypothetical protein
MSLREPEDLLRIDLERAQEGGVDLLEAVQQARGGDPLELDLVESGFYGQQVQARNMSAMALVALGDLLSFLRQQAVEDRWAIDQNILLNFAFKNGHHYIEVDRGRRAVVPLPAPRGIVRRSVDKFGPWYRAQHGKLSGGMPQSQVVAKSNTTENKDAAEYGEELEEWIAPQAWSHQHRSELAMWMLLGGTATMFQGIEWSRDPDPDYFEATGGEDEQGMMHRPDLVFQIHSPLEIWTDNRTASVSGKRWIGRDLFMPVSEARALYLDPDDQRRIVPISGDAMERGYHTLRDTQRLLGMSDPWGRAGPSSGPRLIDEEDEAVVSEFWGRAGIVLQGQHFDGLVGVQGLTVEVLDDGSEGQLPLVRFPNGIRVTFTPEGWILEIADNHHRYLPFQEFKCSQSAGYWTPAWATMLREINGAINWNVSLSEQHLVRVGNPTLLEPTEAQVHRRGGILGTISRLIYRGNRFNNKPEWMNPPTMPSDRVQLMTELERIWQDVAGIHEVSQGRLPTRLSGVAVALLQEQDVSQLGFAGQEIEAGYASVMRMALRSIQAFFPDTDPRLRRLAGDGPYRLRAFMAADVENDLSIQVRPGSAIPRSPAAVKAEAMELWEAGALLDDFGRPDFRKLMEAYGQGSRDELYFEDDVDEQNARTEEELILDLHPTLAEQVAFIFMQTGELPPPFNVKAFDNDLVHERRHRLTLKKLALDPNVGDLQKQLLEWHWMGHVAAALPILAQTNPDVVAGLLAGPAGGPGDDGTGEGGGNEQPPEA